MISLASQPRNSLRKHRPEVLHGASMHYAPVNELGVVYLFADYAKKHRLHVEVMRPGFPDCIAYQKSNRIEKEIKIEFEFRAKNFLTHKHDHKKCDWIVCWENNWPGAPSTIRIIELRELYGLGFNVWIVPVGDNWKDELRESTHADWSVPSLAHKGDLVLYYFTTPEKYIAGIYKLEAHPKRVKANWKEGEDYETSIRLIAWLKCPLHLEEMKQNKVLLNAGFMRARFQGRHNVTEFQHTLFDLIIKRNPSLRKVLTKYL